MVEPQSKAGEHSTLSAFVSALSTIASENDPQRLADGIAGLLLDALGAEWAAVRVRAGEYPYEAVRTIATGGVEQGTSRAARSAAPPLPADADSAVVLDTCGPLRVVRQPLPHPSFQGDIAAGAERADFPNATEQLLLEIAASQAGLLFNHLFSTQTLGAHAERFRALDATRAQNEADERARAAESLLDSEERFYLLVASVVDYAIFLLDTDGNVASWNAGAERLKQYSADEIIGQHFSRFYMPEDRERGTPQHLLAIAEREGHVKDEGWRVRKDGSRFWADVVITALRDNQGRLRGYAKVTRDVSERRHVAEQLEQSRARLRRLATHVQTAREEERTTIARELHDELGQMLTVARLDLSRLARRLGAETPEALSAAEAVADVRGVIQSIDECLKATRRIMQQLRPQLLDEFGLRAALEAHTQQFQQRTNIQCVLAAPEELEPLTPAQEIAVFRIVQEALTNVARHAGAGRVRVSLSMRSGDLWVEIQDNGRGIAPGDLEKAGHFGLQGMQERAILLGGEVNIRAEPGQGTTVTARVPLAEPVRG